MRGCQLRLPTGKVGNEAGCTFGVPFPSPFPISALQTHTAAPACKRGGICKSRSLWRAEINPEIPSFPLLSLQGNSAFCPCVGEPGEGAGV